MNSIIQCEKCGFCDKFIEYGYDFREFAGGYCRKNPPVYIGRDENGEAIWKQPYVDKDCGCGEGAPE